MGREGSLRGGVTHGAKGSKDYERTRGVPKRGVEGLRTKKGF